VVPYVLHLKLAQARARIAKRHCRVGEITRRHSSPANKGRVIQQHPKASKIRRKNGFKIDLTVGK
jgi:beta-lactam-binding protein with PASTA domain